MKQRICSLADLKTKTSIGFQFGDVRGFVVYLDGNIHAFSNACPHIGTTLEFAKDKFLDADGRFIQCSMHGALFQIEDGLCIHGPCLGDSLEPLSVQLLNDAVFLLKPH